MEELTRLEEGMWTASSRYDPDFQEERFAHDFFEFGRSGRIYSREQIVRIASIENVIRAHFPLDGLSFRLLGEWIVQSTYNSHVEYDGIIEHARRSSIWVREAGVWKMKFHQGTPYIP